MSHGDRVTRLPDGFEVIAVSCGAPFAAIADEERKLYAVQFHPEVVHTPDGARLISNFVHRIAGLAGDWTMAHFRSSEIAKIRAAGRTRGASSPAFRVASTAPSRPCSFTRRSAISSPASSSITA